jgi:hypothetical protein
MNNVCKVLTTTITPNGSAALSFVIPSTSTCLWQVEGLNDTGLSALATKDGVAHSSLLLA